LSADNLRAGSLAGICLSQMVSKLRAPERPPSPLDTCKRFRLQPVGQADAITDVFFGCADPEVRHQQPAVRLHLLRLRRV
jgi:hypothetical protein